jgi:ATP-dependent protease Clp ATPase subunit
MSGKKLMFDTSNLTVVFMGSFDELYKEKQEQQKYKHKTVGFNSVKEEEKESKVRVDEDDLVKWLGPEFVGRIGTITSTDKLSLEDAINLLSKSKLSQLNILREDLANRGIKLLCTNEYKKEIAKKGMSETTGVRKLNKTIKDNVKYAYDEILTRDDVKVLKLSKATALDPRKYFLG